MVLRVGFGFQVPCEGSLRYDVEHDIEYECDDALVGIPVFDALTAEQQLTLLADDSRRRVVFEHFD